MSFFRTRITDLLKIKYPIVQGAMGAGFVSTGELAAGVANAGGIGIMSAIQWKADLSKLEDEIKKVRDLTDKPFGINLTLFTEVQKDLFFNILDIIEKHKVPVVETSARSPEPYVARIKETGATWIHKVARIKDGVKAAKLGAQAITIIGSEEGGHPGAERNATSVVGPLMADKVDVPVIIGGGFCDGRGLVAVLALGGEAMVMGTRFVASKECVVHPNVKKVLVDMAHTDTDYILMSIGDPVRAWSNKLTRSVLKAEAGNDQASLISLLAPIEKQNEEDRMAMNTGDVENGLVPAGQVAGRIDRIKSCREIIDDIIKEADEVLNKLADRKYYKAKK